jgi:hypothetical protein
MLGCSAVQGVSAAVQQETAAQVPWFILLDKDKAADTNCLMAAVTICCV